MTSVTTVTDTEVLTATETTVIPRTVTVTVDTVTVTSTSTEKQTTTKLARCDIPRPATYGAATITEAADSSSFLTSETPLVLEKAIFVPSFRDNLDSSRLSPSVGGSHRYQEIPTITVTKPIRHVDKNDDDRYQKMSHFEDHKLSGRLDHHNGYHYDKEPPLSYNSIAHARAIHDDFGTFGGYNNVKDFYFKGYDPFQGY